MLYIYINDKRAREASPRSHFAREVPPDGRLTGARPRAGAFFAPVCRPTANIHRFLFRPRGTPKIDRFSDHSKSTKVGDKVAHWPPHGRQWLHLGDFRGSFWDPFFIIFLTLFRTPQNLDFAIHYTTSACFKQPKSSHFGTPFL